MKILIIEDEKDIAELIQFNLKREGIASEICRGGREVLAKIRKCNPNLVILDLMLPEVGGLEICRQLRADPATQNIAVLMLTAKGEEIDRIVGFEVGADDYLTKPFSPRELVLRVKAVLNRTQRPSRGAKISFGDLCIDPEKFEVRVRDEEIRLTAIEFKLLQYFLDHKGRVASRDLLLDRVWGYDAALTTRTVDSHIKRLRQKLKGAGDYIETLRGVG